MNSLIKALHKNLALNFLCFFLMFSDANLDILHTLKLFNA